MQATAEAIRAAADEPVPAWQAEREFHVPAAVAAVSGVTSVLAIPLAPGFHPALFAVLPVFAMLAAWRARSRISAAPEELCGAGVATLGLWTGVVGLAGGWLLSGYVYLTEVPEGFERISYARLKLAEGSTEIPAEAQALNGKKVFIKGFVYPGNESSGIRRFVLCRDNGDCCFGGQPPISDMIQVTLQDHVRLTFRTHQFKVYGTFRVEPSNALHDLGGVLYHLDDAEFRE